MSGKAEGSANLGQPPEQFLGADESEHHTRTVARRHPRDAGCHRDSVVGAQAKVKTKVCGQGTFLLSGELSSEGGLLHCGRGEAGGWAGKLLLQTGALQNSTRRIKTRGAQIRTWMYFCLKFKWPHFTQSRPSVDDHRWLPRKEGSPGRQGEEVTF